MGQYGRRPEGTPERDFGDDKCCVWHRFGIVQRARDVGQQQPPYERSCVACLAVGVKYAATSWAKQSTRQRKCCVGVATGDRQPRPSHAAPAVGAPDGIMAEQHSCRCTWREKSIHFAPPAATRHGRALEQVAERSRCVQFAKCAETLGYPQHTCAIQLQLFSSTIAFSGPRSRRSPRLHVVLVPRRPRPREQRPRQRRRRRVPWTRDLAKGSQVRESTGLYV